jgi:hypothetical protein
LVSPLENLGRRVILGGNRDLDPESSPEFNLPTPPLEIVLPRKTAQH